MEQLLPGLTSAPNLHPMVVHFPIAFWIAATGAWSLALARKRDDAWRFGRWLHLLGLLGAAVAVGFGFWATEEMGHDTPGHDLVHVHRDLMLVATGIALVVTALAWWRGDASRRWRVGLMVGSLLLLGVMTIGADRGAELVFRYGIGVAGETPPHSDGHDHAHVDQEAEAEVHDHGAQPPSHTGHEHPPERGSEPGSEEVAGEPPHSDEASSAGSEESPGPASAEPSPAGNAGDGHRHQHDNHEH
ncbi:DUF2231 domain-containing protein [Microvenator marinus]|uniref:DUF2231 domain-containing protein n=1 Tax=Microvenator marinus TaxID=2600177 RepID=A0A5B8XNN9_9DELT|nr:DUF2231 domain-containing protein [Microvenator marinus]